MHMLSKKNIYGVLGFYVYSLNIPVGLIALSTFFSATKNSLINSHNLLVTIEAN